MQLLKLLFVLFRVVGVFLFVFVGLLLLLLEGGFVLDDSSVKQGNATHPTLPTLSHVRLIAGTAPFDVSFNCR
jgi:hypothetical protein